MQSFKIPHFGLARQYKNLKDELLDATDQALRSGCLIGGHFTREFENWLVSKTKTSYALTVHSGTQALAIIARAKLLNYLYHNKATPKIRIPNLTYPATLNAFIESGWEVELADTDRYGVVLPTRRSPNLFHCVVGLYGRKPWATDTMVNKYDYDIIVDGAQHWLVADGNVGYGMAISFDPTKNLPASGNGGAIVTNDKALYEFAMEYRNNGYNALFSQHTISGTNSKMSEQDCAHMLVRAKYIDEWQRRREQIAEYYRERCKDLPVIVLNDGTESHANQKFVLYSEYRNLIHGGMILSGIETK